MKITFLGTGSGTEPWPGYHHSSFVIEYNGAIYWFDAGESCSYTAHLLGIDIMATRAIFITHAHMDHIGGLPNLLWTCRKLNIIAAPEDRRLSGKTISVCLPDLEVWAGVMQMLRGTQGGYEINFRLEPRLVGDGVVFDEDGFRVTAVHNQHMGVPQAGDGWKSFSYRLEGNGRSLIYSGDVGHISELDGLLASGCDLLLMETGHHDVAEVCRYLRDTGNSFGRLVFTHHGLAVLADPNGELQKAKAILGNSVSLAEDGMTLDW